MSPLRLASLIALAIAVLWAVIGPRPAMAHDLSMSVLELEQLNDGRFAMRWPGSRPMGTENLNPIFPQHCVIDPPFVDCGDEGLVGPLSFEGLGAGQSAAMIRVNYTNGFTQAFTLTPAVPSVNVKPVFNGEGWDLWRQVFQSYVFIGVEHIMLGIDHLMFVLGLIWIVRSRWMLVKTITSFTLAHSVTLAAVTFGFIGVPEQLVNALIALSIVFIGVEIIKQKRGETSLTIRHPWIVAFGFGLLHGFGFASALINLGLPENSLLLALLAFNLGVEIGQIGFVFGVLILMAAFRSMKLALPSWGVAIPAYVIGGVAAYWTMDRIVILLTT